MESARLELSRRGGKDGNQAESHGGQLKEFDMRALLL
jgi:hypothetical protein